MDQQEALAFIERHTWIFAKTRPLNPHAYIVRGKSESEGFNALVLFIRKHGQERTWGRKRYIVWYAPDGFHYWTMGWPVRETTIINRAHTATQDQTTEPVKVLPFSSADGFAPEGYVKK